MFLADRIGRWRDDEDDGSVGSMDHAREHSKSSGEYPEAWLEKRVDVGVVLPK